MLGIKAIILLIITYNYRSITLSLISSLCIARGVEFHSSVQKQNSKNAVTKGKIFSYVSKSTFEVGESSSQHPPPPSTKSKEGSIKD